MWQRSIEKNVYFYPPPSKSLVIKHLVMNPPVFQKCYRLFTNMYCCCVDLKTGSLLNKYHSFNKYFEYLLLARNYSRY